MYEFLKSHKWLYRFALLTIIAVLAFFASRLRYTEDILSFMPFDEQQRQQFQIYQERSESQTITLIFEGNDADSIIDAIEQFATFSEQQNIAVRTAFDPSELALQTDSVSHMLPFLLTPHDYQRIDSLLTTQYINQQIHSVRTKLLMPQSGILQPILSTDPLSLFTEYIHPPQHAQGAFDIIDGYIFTADHTRAFAFIESPYGSNESGKNSILVDSIYSGIFSTQHLFPTVKIRPIGAPVISVTNARRIKRDSIITITIALIAIAALLLTTFRRKRDIILMLLTVGFGMLFALGIMGIITNEISLIVLGISSVIVGIAFNYPLHLIIHRDQRSDMPTTLREVLSPLIVGNITTVGAFLCLVPLQSKALHDLGLFSALMLIGTILFTTCFLPQLIENYSPTNRNDATDTLINRTIDLIASIRPHTNKYILTSVCILTIILAIFAPRLQFDSNLNNINYMTDQQRADINYFLNIAEHTNTQTVYIVQQINNPDSYIKCWNNFWQQHSSQLQYFLQAADSVGFRPQAFATFFNLTSHFNQPTLAQHQITRTINVRRDLLQETEQLLSQQYPDAQIFDIQSLNSQLTNTISDNFNYIGIACSLIVLIFLCISFKSIPIGLIAFTPMLIAWIWILGIMYIFGLQFNIVNIILATFIFGQGDDYTIFIVEGLIYEHSTGRPILTAYKRSIILSSLIMFIGIGILVIARHPAMHSLGIITILGMICVVLMAYIIPPILYQFYLKTQQKISQIR